MKVIIILEATWLNWCHSTSLLLQMSDYNYLSKDNNLSEFLYVYFQISYVFPKSDGQKIQEPEKSLFFLARLIILGQTRFPKLFITQNQLCYVTTDSLSLSGIGSLLVNFYKYLQFLEICQ